MRFFLAALALVLLADAAHSQRNRSFAEQGDLALVIGVSGLEDLALRPYEGGLGLRYRAADQTVLGAAFGLSFSDREVDSNYQTPDGGTIREGTGESQRIALALWAEQHLGRPRRTVSPFVGAGLQVATYMSEDEQIVSFSCPENEECRPDDRVSGKSERLSVAGGLILGAEIRLAAGVTLGGAYTIGAEYLQYESTYSRDTQDGPVMSRDEGDDWQIGVGTTQVGLSVYF